MADLDLGPADRRANFAEDGPGLDVHHTHYMLVVSTVGTMIIIVVAVLFMSLF